MGIFYFLYEAVPRSDNPEKDHCAGAYIAVWVDSFDVHSAETEAKNYIHEEGWQVIGMEEQDIVCREYYEQHHELHEFLEGYDEAETNGISSIFYVWPYNA